MTLVVGPPWSFEDAWNALNDMDLTRPVEKIELSEHWQMAAQVCELSQRFVEMILYARPGKER